MQSSSILLLYLFTRNPSDESVFSTVFPVYDSDEEESEEEGSEYKGPRGQRSRTGAREQTPSGPAQQETPAAAAAAGKQTITVADQNYNLLHNILFYIYTNRILLTLKSKTNPSGPGSPRPCDVEGIYSVAEKLFIEKLRQKCLSFLKETCAIDNITKRLMGTASKESTELSDMYQQYFKANWAEISRSRDHKEAMKDLRSEAYDIEEGSDFEDRFDEIMKGVDLK
jgi:hypothetical protein